MNYYEQFRNDLIENLSRTAPGIDINRILFASDEVARAYTFGRAVMELSVPYGDGIPQILRVHVAALGVAKRSVNTLKSRVCVLRNFFGMVRKPFSDITTNDIRTYLYTYERIRGIKESTLDNIRINIHCFFAWCVREGYLTANPAEKVDPIRYEYPERSRLSQLDLEIVRKSCQTLREKAMVDFLYSTACRCAELCAMRISDVDFASQTVTVRHAKGNRRHITWLNAEAVVSLKAYLDSRTDDSPFLFVSERKPAHGLSNHGVENIVRRIAERTGLPAHITPHVFRHTAATIAMSVGMPVEHIQKFLGHARLDTTMIYAKQDESDVRASHRKYVT